MLVFSYLVLYLLYKLQTTATMEFISTNYEFAHGRKPKGYGRWIFKITGTDNEGSYLTEQVEATGKLAEARRMAVREFKASSNRIKRIVRVEVEP